MHLLVQELTFALYLIQIYTNTFKMQVPDDIVNEWLELKEWRDTQRIAKIIGIAPQNVSVILHTGKGTVKQIAEIVKYFEPRKKLKAKLIDDLN